MNESKLRACRVNKGWTQENLAKEVGVSRTTITNWESDDSNIPEFRYEILEKVLGLNPGYFSQDDANDRENKITPIDALMKNQPGLKQIYYSIFSITLILLFVKPYAPITMVWYAITMMILVVVTSSPDGDGTICEKIVTFLGTAMFILIMTLLCLTF